MPGWHAVAQAARVSSQTCLFERRLLIQESSKASYRLPKPPRVRRGEDRHCPGCISVTFCLSFLYRASLSLQPKKIQEELQFPSMRETIDFLQKEGAVFSADGKVDSKKSLVHFEKSSLLSKKVKAMG